MSFVVNGYFSMDNLVENCFVFTFNFFFHCIIIGFSKAVDNKTVPLVEVKKKNYAQI